MGYLCDETHIAFPFVLWQLWVTNSSPGETMEAKERLEHHDRRKGLSDLQPPPHPLPLFSLPTPWGWGKAGTHSRKIE